jgi:hypothetical protein
VSTKSAKKARKEIDLHPYLKCGRYWDNDQDTDIFSTAFCKQLLLEQHEDPTNALVADNRS